MGAVRGGRGRLIAVAAAVTAALGVVAIAAWTPTDRRVPPPGASGAAPTEPATVGPIVYYEVLDAHGARLMERRLDGHSLARRVAERTDGGYGRTWGVDPTGTIAVALVPGPDDQQLEAISIATGAALWTARTPLASIGAATWAADGSRFAITTSGGDVEPREAVVVDSATGRFARVTIPDDAIVQAFDGDGGLILRRRLATPAGDTRGWQFLRFDPGRETLERLAAPPAVGPASDSSEDVDPAVGLAVDLTAGANDQGAAIRLWTLQTSATRILATLPSIDLVAIDPTGTGVAISAAQAIRFVRFDGRTTDLYSGEDPISDFGWSTAGDYLAVTTDRQGPNLTIVERSTGRSVLLPQPDAVAQLQLVRIVGGIALPDQPLPAAEPSPTPTPGPSGADVAGTTGILSGWVERAGDVQTAHVQRLVPTTAGGLRVAAEMPPLDLGPVVVATDRGPNLELLPRPGSTDILVWVGFADRSAGWLWDGGSALRPLDLPPDWPAASIAYDVAWRPDGRALAASAGGLNADGDFESNFVVAELGGRSTRVIPIVGDYDRLEGWWSPTELRVGHGICTEGCAGRYAYSARLRIADRRLTQMTAADRRHAPIDEVSFDDASIVLSLINEEAADDIAITWPAALGPTDQLADVAFAGDGRTLLVASGTATGTDLYRIADPVGRAAHGRLADPAPELVLHLDGRDLTVEVGPDGDWALVTDRVEDVRLVRLADGQSWPVDRDRILAWPDQW